MSKAYRGTYYTSRPPTGDTAEMRTRKSPDRPSLEYLRKRLLAGQPTLATHAKAHRARSEEMQSLKYSGCGSGNCRRIRM